MGKQVCSKCEEEKLLDEFFFRNKKTGKRHSQCKKCSREGRKSKEHYEKYKEQYAARNKRRRERLLIENVEQLLKYLNEHPCVDCGETDYLVLEFDHLIREEKEYGISKMMTNYSWDKILKEITKCEVVCSNCHKRRTAKQFGWYKYRVVEEENLAPDSKLKKRNGY